MISLLIAKTPMQTALPSKLLAISLLLPMSAAATDWTQLKGDAIRAALSDRNVAYTSDDKTFQTFHNDGRTTFVEGRPSVGNWRATATQYCSQWPPSDSWTCYDLLINEAGSRIRFIGESGRIWEARYQ